MDIKVIKDIKKDLDRWYSRLRSRYVDLVGDFGGSELFVIEGDSLLYKFICDPKRHFLNFGELYGGGQFLSLTFLVETFLNKLKQRGCNFHLLFFHEHKGIWNCDPKFRIAREIIIEHLKSCQDESKIPIYEFSSWWNSEFNQYIVDRQPLFILSGDGTNEEGAIEDGTTEDLKISLTYNNNEILISLIPKIQNKLTILLKGLFYNSLHKDLSMALIPGMEFRDSRARAFVFDRGGNVNQSTIEKLPDIVSLCEFEAVESNEENLWTNIEKDFITSVISNIFNKRENEEILKNGGQRLILVIISLIAVLHQNS
ncbi:5203_t:CDS:2, partial [Scutellospora calospora]